MARSMFSIREQRLASGRSHRRSGSFAECALGILIHGHGSPPHPGQGPLSLLYAQLKTSADTTLGAADKTQHHAFSTSSAKQCGRYKIWNGYIPTLHNNIYSQLLSFH